MNKINKLIIKIRKKGIRWLLFAIHVRMLAIEYAVFKLFPINKRLIVFESDGDLTDNSYALYEYLRTHGYLEKYKIVWMVHDVSRAKELSIKKRESFPNTVFSNKDVGKINIKRTFFLATCKWFIYDHSNLVCNYSKRKGQSIIFISHGFGVKAGKGIRPVRNNFDINIVLGDIPAENAPRDWGGTLLQTRQWGYPRNDYLFADNYSVKRLLDVKLAFRKYCKIILWMPTFRKTVSYGVDLSENYIQNETGMPLFQTLNELRKFDAFLLQLNVLVILKLHPLQANLEVFSFSFSNIIVLRNEDIQDMDIQLYQMIRYTDALITDYSSISTDYMLLNKPIIYVLDDYEEYKKARGISPENAIDLLVGYHVTNIKEIENAISEIVDGTDKFQIERNELLPQLHKYIDGNACERIVKNLNL